MRPTENAQLNKLARQVGSVRQRYQPATSTKRPTSLPAIASLDGPRDDQPEGHTHLTSQWATHTDAAPALRLIPNALEQPRSVVINRPERPSYRHQILGANIVQTPMGTQQFLLHTLEDLRSQDAQLGGAPHCHRKVLRFQGRWPLLHIITQMSNGRTPRGYSTLQPRDDSDILCVANGS